jgi:dCMP deaminase
MINENRLDIISWGLEEAFLIAKRSKDPSTQVGCIITRPDNSVASKGYNGFPKGVPDEPALYANETKLTEKYPRIVHAERNALHFCRDYDLTGYTAYVNVHPCANCTADMLQRGIRRFVCAATLTGGVGSPENWSNDQRVANDMMEKAGAQVTILPDFKPAEQRLREELATARELLDEYRKQAQVNRLPCGFYSPG